jgi:hypothetical protein
MTKEKIIQAIRALAEDRDLDPQSRYDILGDIGSEVEVQVCVLAEENDLDEYEDDDEFEPVDEFDDDFDDEGEFDDELDFDDDDEFDDDFR